MLSMHFLIQCRVTKVNKVLTVSRDEGKELLTVSRDVFSLHEISDFSPAIVLKLLMMLFL